MSVWSPIPLHKPPSGLETRVLLSMLVMVKGKNALYHCTRHWQIGQNSCPLHQSSFRQQIPKCLIKLNYIHSSLPSIDTRWHPPYMSELPKMDFLPSPLFSLHQLFPPLAVTSPTALHPTPVGCLQETWASSFYSRTKALISPLAFWPSASCLHPAAEVPHTPSLPHFLTPSFPHSLTHSLPHSLTLPPTQPKPLPSGDDLFVYLDSKLSRAGTVSNCMFVPYLQLCWTEYTHCHLLLETKFLLGVSSTEK